MPRDEVAKMQLHELLLMSHAFVDGEETSREHN
jgi:hypothetical protein